LTFEVQSGAGREFIKWAPTGCDTTLEPEIARLRWAALYMDVPKVLDHGSDDAGTWLVTEGVPGDNAVSTRWKADPKTAVTAIGQGLRALHHTLPARECPFSWTAETRLAEVHRLAARGRLAPAHWPSEHQALDVATAMQIADQPPAIDQLVVCHGDACAPNTLIADNGSWTGHVDFGSLGVADRWADLAIATWSTQWNYGPGWEGCLLDAYGIDPDPRRTAYYRLLWDLGP
jgi:kanamycin kinase